MVDSVKERARLAKCLRYSIHKVITQVDPKEFDYVSEDQCKLLAVQLTPASLKLIIDTLEEKVSA